MSATPAPQATSTPAAPEGAALAQRLGPVRLGLRSDLEVTRHLFRGEPAYVIRDPVTFRTHRLDAADYQILCHIQPGSTLAQTFRGLVAAGRLGEADEPRFYQFMLSLHRLGFAALPISDEKLLYQRHQARQAAARRARWMSVLFLRIPLVNPDAFLNRTLRFVQPLFSRGFLPFYVLLMLAAGYVAWRRWDDLFAPLEGMLASQNLPLLWLSLVVLKAFHEMGHAYACKRFGGNVPEMGAYLIMFTPCAYVDATASWSFTRKRERVFVCLAGMYVESILAALALLYWSFTEPSLLHDAAYNVIFFAGVITVLFNINPLMRYDGYYICADLLEIPNLRARASQCALDLARRLTLGIHTGGGDMTRRLKLILATYGISAAVYRLLMLAAIAALVAGKLPFVGLALAAAYLLFTAWSYVRRTTSYLWYADETRPVRVRAVALSILLLLVAPAVLLLVPAPDSVVASAVVACADERVVHSAQAGFVVDAPIRPGHSVGPGDTLIRLNNDALEEASLEAESAVEACRLRQDAFRDREPARVREERQREAALSRDWQRRRAESAELDIRSGAEGVVLTTLGPTDIGRYVQRGQPVALVGGGAWRVRTVLDEAQLTDAAPRAGDLIEFRPSGASEAPLRGRVASIAPSGSRAIKLASLTADAGGDIAVQGETHQARQPYFELTIDLDAPPAAALHYGQSGRIRFDAPPQPIGRAMLRRVIRFVRRLGAD